MSGARNACWPDYTIWSRLGIASQYYPDVGQRTGGFARTYMYCDKRRTKDANVSVCYNCFQLLGEATQIKCTTMQGRLLTLTNIQSFLKAKACARVWCRNMRKRKRTASLDYSMLRDVRGFSQSSAQDAHVRDDHGRHCTRVCIVCAHNGTAAHSRN